ncbi:MAG: hypothetical protein HQ472_09850 [Ignavibacteria bacterium]|nr:hypothetical protein [Ignavibacteria bacterium]
MAQNYIVELVAVVNTDVPIESRIHANGNTFLRASPNGVVLALQLTGKPYRTKVLVVQGSKVTEKILDMGRFSQGVLSDDTTLYFTSWIQSDSFLISFDTNFDNLRWYTENENADHRQGTQITALNGVITIVDERRGCVVKRKEDSTYFDVMPNYQYPGPAEAFTIGDTTYYVFSDGVWQLPHDGSSYKWLRGASGQYQTNTNICIVDDSVRYISSRGMLHSFSTENGGFVVRPGVPDNSETTITFGVAGRFGGLRYERGTIDSTFYHYYRYGQTFPIRFGYPNGKTKDPDFSLKAYPFAGWSLGYFYIAVIEDTNKVGVYRIKEPEPPVSVEGEPTEVSAEIDAPQKLSMTAEEFVEWRKQRAVHTTYTDVNGKRLDAIAVVRAGVIMVREGATVFVVLVE